MATSKFHVVFFVSLFFTLIFVLNEAHTAVAKVVVSSDNCEALRMEVDKLTSKIQSLESLLDKKNQELKSKDEIIAQKEKAMTKKEHGQPNIQLIMQKVLEKKSQAEKSAGPHVQTIKSKWVPAARKQSVLVKTSVEPHLYSLAKNIKSACIQSTNILTQQWAHITRKINAFLQA